MCFGASTLSVGAGAITRLESRIKKFTPHCVCRPLGYRALSYATLCLQVYTAAEDCPHRPRGTKRHSERHAALQNFWIWPCECGGRRHHLRGPVLQQLHTRNAWQRGFQMGQFRISTQAGIQLQERRLEFWPVIIIFYLFFFSILERRWEFWPVILLYYYFFFKGDVRSFGQLYIYIYI